MQEPSANYFHVPFDVTCPFEACGYTGKDNEFNLTFKGPDTIRVCPKCGNGHVIATITSSEEGEQPKEESQDWLLEELIETYQIDPHKALEHFHITRKI